MFIVSCRWQIVGSSHPLVNDFIWINLGFSPCLQLLFCWILILVDKMPKILMVLWILHFDISMDWFKGKSTGNHRFSQTHIFQRGRYTTNKLHTQTLWEFLLEPGRVVPWSEPCLQRHLIPGNHRISPSYGHRLKICGSSWKPDGGLERGFYFSVYWECHHPNWRTPSFFRGVGIPPTRKLRIFPPQLKPGPGFSPA